MASYGSNMATSSHAATFVTGQQRSPYPKVIHRPTRVEPKVHLANERTLFHWLNMAVILTTVAVGFLNSSLPGAAWLALLFTAASTVLMGYALRFYYWRMKRIAKRDIEDYSDIRGPIMVSILVLGTLLVGLASWVYGQI
jgi:uncharacterized membrane protein YidH (DUF202 family)